VTSHKWCLDVASNWMRGQGECLSASTSVSPRRRSCASACRRTRRAPPMLQHLIDQQVQHKKGQLFCCFVALEGAYDSVPRKKLLQSWLGFIFIATC